jgi:hypothetical protein
MFMAESSDYRKIKELNKKDNNSTDRKMRKAKPVFNFELEEREKD